MRIDRLEVRNFKKFAALELALHPQFTLLVGENGSGKTSVLDAIAIALGIWLIKTPDSLLANSRRPIYSSEKRLEWVRLGDRSQFLEASGEVAIKATGQINGYNLSWEQSIGIGKRKTSYLGAKQAQNVVQRAYDRAQAGEHVLLPVIAYYGAGRAWLPHHDRKQSDSVKPNGSAHRWAALYDCLNERIRIADLTRWFWDETAAAGNQGGRFRPGFEAVRRAILQCVPGADNVWFDTDRKDIVLSIGGAAQPFGNLSAGQRMMLALVADIAIKAVTQNNYLVPPDARTADSDRTTEVLRESPGVILIDELDVHLHPRWQRRVANDLKRTFPKLQFVCTTHSPQVIGEASASEVRLLSESGPETPAQSYGMDSNWILKVLMAADYQDAEVSKLIENVSRMVADGKLDEADKVIQTLRHTVGNSEPIQRASSFIDRARMMRK